ncbi:MAG: DUF285 domain-containing protein, partial [Prevotella sp.]|nr:DUF285 domain-containing protein [Prevotella sp.]
MADKITHITRGAVENICERIKGLSFDAETLLSLVPSVATDAGAVASLLAAVRAATGAAIAYVFVNGDGGESVLTVDGSDEVIAAGETVRGTCDTLALADGSNLIGAYWCGDVVLNFGDNTNLRAAVGLLSSSHRSYGWEMFCRCTSLSRVAMYGGVWTNLGRAFMNTLLHDISFCSTWDVSSCTTLYYAFYQTGITDISALANWDTSLVTNMQGTFYGCTGLTDLTPLANWDTSLVTNMQGTFYGCTGLTDLTPLANWDTSQVTTLYCTFYGCTGLTDISALANWDTSLVTNMQGTFYG